MRSGFYYFSPPGTPFYPGVHNLGSREWISDEHDLEKRLGEYQGPRIRYNGDPPARLPLPVLVGDAACVRNGETPGLPIVIGASAFCGKILPPLCYDAGDDLAFLTNVLDCTFAHRSAVVIDKAYPDLPSAVADVEAYLGPDATVTSFPQANAETPAGVVAIQGTTAIVWLTGTTDYNQAAAQAFYFGLGPISVGLYSVSSFYEAAALSIADSLSAAGGAAATRIVLIGHSFGGAVAEVLAAKLRLANPLRAVELLTFGAPQAGDQRLIDILEPLRQRHYALQRDPIPFLPPTGFNFAAFLPLIGDLLALFWPTFARVPTIRTITPAGDFVDERTADMSDDLEAIAVLAIAAGRDLPIFQQHRIEWYAYWLCVACKCVARPCVEPDVNAIAFSFELEGLEFVQALTPFTENYTRAELTFDEPAQWFALDGGYERVRVTSSIDENGIYSPFVVSYFFRDGETIFARFDWQFTSAEMFGGILTVELPEMFSLSVDDAVTSLVQLKMIPTLT